MTTVSVCCRHVAAAKIDAEVTRLETEHGIKCRDAIKKVAYAPDYRPGDTGEFAFIAAPSARTPPAAANTLSGSIAAGEL